MMSDREQFCSWCDILGGLFWSN
uniref:Uncharacterized protein n=1 Tax=Arundo donax TaxID=35708 RepID=A0A0A8Y6L5_ARUDO